LISATTGCSDPADGSQAHRVKTDEPRPLPDWAGERSVCSRCSSWGIDFAVSVDSDRRNFQAAS
jgi:hypothetical protein